MNAAIRRKDDREDAGRRVGALTRAIARSRGGSATTRTPLTDLDAPRPARRSWWLEEALALPEFAGPDTPPLQGNTDADVVILGGGYTGMWTAWFLKEREPALDVVLLERDICGGGPSGRNGGFVNGLYDEAGLLLERHGEGGRRTIEAAARSIDEVGAWCEGAGVDAWFEPSGDLGVSTNPAHDASVRETVSEAERLGLADVYRPLSEDEVRQRFDSPAVRTGFRVAHAATVHPARLARGLRRALVERGVRIFEGTPVVRFDARRPAAETPSGVVRAGRAIVALNARARALRDFRRSLLLRGTYIVMSAPAPERLEAMRWTGGEGVRPADLLHYLRPTRDGRIAFGGSSLRATGEGADWAGYGYDGRSAAALVRDFRRFPAFHGAARDLVGRADRRRGPAPAVLRHAAGRGHTLRAGVHGERGRPVSPRGQDPLGPRARGGGRGDDAPDLGRRPHPLPTRALFSIGERLVSRAIVRRDDRLDARRFRRADRPPGSPAETPGVHAGAVNGSMPAIEVARLTKSYGRARCRRPDVLGGARGDLRVPGAERRGQDDHDPDPARLHPPKRGPRDRPRSRRAPTRSRSTGASATCRASTVWSNGSRGWSSSRTSGRSGAASMNPSCETSPTGSISTWASTSRRSPTETNRRSG